MFDSLIIAPLFRDDFVAQQFSDEQLIAYLLTVEVALANVQSRLGVIPADVAETIQLAISGMKVDLAQLRESVKKSSIPTISLVSQIRHATEERYEPYIHWGATSQDIMDTALILQLRACIDYIKDLMIAVIQQFGAIAHQHRKTIMAGRTHSQQALPITFGFKVAGWIAPLLRHINRLQGLKTRLLVVQLGGAVGTLASLGNDGLAVERELAMELGLGLPEFAWHTQRDNLVEFASWLALVTGSLAKMAQDIILMAQTEIGELRESDDPSRGGSSTMPQKSNPIISELIVTAARTQAGLLSNMVQAMIHEHERATGAWQMEWLALPQMVHLTAVSLSHADFLSKNLVVDTRQMRENVANSNGMMMAEALDLALAPHLGRGESKAVIKQAVKEAVIGGKHLVDVVSKRVAVDIDWDKFRDESNYLGAAQERIDKVLNQVENLGG